MAVATHVSRVAKDYAPFGYSIMETASATVFTEKDGTVNKSEVLLIADDADIYIESITILAITAVTADGTHFLDISCESFESGGTESASHFTAFDTKADSLAAETQYAKTVLNPLVKKGRQLVFKVGKPATGGGGEADEREIGISLRYRRKA
jgi:hypothetical protein